MVPESSLARDRCRICRAMLTISSKVMFPLCLLNVFLLLSVPWWFLEGFDDQGRSRRYHLNLGLSVLVSFIVILRPFQSPVALAISSPTFFVDRPRGPILGARADVAPTSPPVHLRYTGRKKELVPPQKGLPNHSSPSAVLLAEKCQEPQREARHDTPPAKARTAPSTTWDGGLGFGHRCRSPHHIGLGAAPPPANPV